MINKVYKIIRGGFLVFILMFVPILEVALDSPFRNQIGFQDPATPVMAGIIYLHDYIWGFLVFILIFVSWMLIRILILFKEKNAKKIYPVKQNMLLEIIWTVTPAAILALIAGNSISHLYSSEESLNPSLDVVIVGNQWYWVYEFMVFSKKVLVESHMIETVDLREGEIRLLEVDLPLVLPAETSIRLLVSSNDVIHSWAVPSLGVKVDAIPGRINETTIYISREGTFRGQCSEICGRGHAVMPIVVKAVSKEDYSYYLHILKGSDFEDASSNI